MMSSLVNLVLFVALVITSLCVLAMYRKLKRFDAYQAEYNRLFNDTSIALSSAGDAVRAFGTEGKEVADSLGARIDEAKAVLAQLTAATQAARHLQGASEPNAV